jgi:chemotaxis protein CheX
MNDQDIQVFITAFRRYFESLKTDLRVVIEPPYIKDQDMPFLEYTGIISIEGKAHGAVCFTATGQMLENILRRLNEAPVDPALIRDLVGEIANTVSGNAREKFGREFLISVPIVSVDHDSAGRFPADCRNYVIPLIWQSERAYLFVCLS